MGLQMKFLHVSTDTVLRISEMEVNKKYSIIMGERVVTHLGQTVTLTLQDNPERLFKIFPPKRYARNTSDGNISINRNRDSFNLIYKGMDGLSRYVLAIQ